MHVLTLMLMNAIVQGLRLTLFRIHNYEILAIVPLMRTLLVLQLLKLYSIHLIK